VVKKKIKKSAPRGPMSPTLGGGGGGGMMQQIRQLQEEMARTQENLGDETVEVSVGGGVLQMVMTGNQRLLSVKIEPDILNADDVEMLQDLVVAAVNEAIERSQQLASERMGSLTGGLNLPGLF
jgi:DNA-binding YbaB/EbfC family protein